MVRVCKLLGVHADALIGDGDHIVAIAVALADDLDACVGRRELRGVLHQLREEVCEIDGHSAGNRRVVQGEQLNAGEVLDFADRHTDDVGHVDGARAASRGLSPGEHEKRLCVAAHAGREMIEPEEVLELVRVGLRRFQLVDELDLTVEQRLVAPGQADEDLADALAQERRLLVGNGAGDPLNAVECPRQLTDLVFRVDPDREHLTRGFVRPRVAKALDERRELFARECVGALGEPAERLGDRAGHERRQEQRDEYGRREPEPEVAGVDRARPAVAHPDRTDCDQGKKRHRERDAQLGAHLEVLQHLTLPGRWLGRDGPIRPSFHRSPERLLEETRVIARVSGRIRGI